MIREFDSLHRNSKSIVSTLHNIDTVWPGYNIFSETFTTFVREDEVLGDFKL